MLHVPTPRETAVTASADLPRRWGEADLPDLTGKTVVITGANSGLGFESTRMMARAGAQVVMACRSLDKGSAALDRVRAVVPEARLDLRRLDLADLGSVAAFAERLLADYARLDVLLANAGVMATPRRETADGFELQLGTNHLGHFALVGRLWPALVATPRARVVIVSSQAHRFGRMHFDDLMMSSGYNPWKAYGQSKLANLLFTLELTRRAEATGADVLCAAAHPGWAATELQAAGPRMAGARLMEKGSALANRIFAQSAARGALPQVCAAVAPQIRPGDYIGPRGPGEMRGDPSRVGRSARASDAEAARALWRVSEALTRVSFASA